MKSSLPPPSFHEWVRFCFGDAIQTRPKSEASIHDRSRRYHHLDTPLLMQYLTQLFEAPAWISREFSDFQVAQATWFIFGNESGYFERVRGANASKDEQIRCLRAIGTLYTDLYDRLCGRRGTDPDSELRNTVELDVAVYMIWDMDQLPATVLFPEKHPHLVEPAISVLEHTLLRCRTSTCRVSALHGIGHLVCRHDDQGDKSIAARLQRIVDTFLERTDLRKWLRDYAVQAREGAVL
jgi:hypothetical protein